PHAEAVSPGLDAIDEPAFDHHAEYAVRGRRVELRFGGELLEIDRRAVPRQRIDQAHHPLDDLDRGFCFFGIHCSRQIRGTGEKSYMMKSRMASVRPSLKNSAGRGEGAREAPRNYMTPQRYARLN